MPGQLLPRRLLRRSSVLVSSPTNGAVSFRRLFPFKLRYSVVQSPSHHQYARKARNCPGWTFSTRAARSRSGSVSKGRKRDALRAGGVSGQSKSLIDDEAELSDWVGDLKMGSLLSKLGSGIDESDGEGRSGQTKNSTRGNVGGRREFLTSGRVKNSKRRRDSDLEEVLNKHTSDNKDCPEVTESNDVQQLQRNSATKDESYLSNTRFDQCSLSPLSLKGLKAAGYERMTVIQEATFPVILKGEDVLAKAKTGTGKTLAFLLPAIEVVLKQPPVNRDDRRPPIYVLVICPTRELANQAAMEAEKLLKFHPTLGVQFVVGGTGKALEQEHLQANPCQILVATPGRLMDHIENTAGFAARLMDVKVLVLDECDHLLDRGFWKCIDKIVRAVPKQRQTLLFSATVPDEVHQVCHIALRRDHAFISTVEEGSEETHSQVSQTVLIAPLDQQFSVVYHLLTQHIADDVDYKVLVFCTTAMVTKLVAKMLWELKLNVREIHSRNSQTYRTKVSDEFRKSKGLILVTSDVSARGVDYPDVTLVIQVGVPSGREQYIHRLGRTGRKGKEGQGVLLLAPWEDFFLSTIKDLPVLRLPLPFVDPEQRRKVDQALCHVKRKIKKAAYMAWLGYYNSNDTVGRAKFRLVKLANEFSRSMGLDNPPTIKKIVLGKMGLGNIPGLLSREEERAGAPSFPRSLDRSGRSRPSLGHEGRALTRPPLTSLVHSFLVNAT